MVLNFDNNCPEFIPYTNPPAPIANLPMWNVEFLRKLGAPDVMSTSEKPYPNIRDAVTMLSRTLDSLAPGHTLIVDSLSIMESQYNAQENAEPPPMVLDTETKKPIVDKRTLFWRRKAWYETFICALCRYPGTVIVTVHEAHETNPKTGLQDGKIYPAITGQMKSKIAGLFNNKWQMVVKGGDSFAEPPKPPIFWVNLQGNEQLGLGTSFKCNKEKLEANYIAFKPYL